MSVYPKVGWQDGQGPRLFPGLVQMDDAIEAAHVEIEQLQGNNAVLNIATLRGQSGQSSNDGRNVLGYYAANDGGGGLFRWNASSSAADNGGTIITPNSSPATGRWERVEQKTMNIECFGVATSQSATTNRNILKAVLPNSTNHFIFARGDYLIDNSSHTAGTAAEILDFSGKISFTPNARWVFTATNASGFVFHGGTGMVAQGVNISFSSTPPIRADSMNPFDFWQTVDTYIDDYYIDRSPCGGITFTECTRPRVTNSYITNTKADGVYFADCQDPVVTNTITDGTGDDGIAFIADTLHTVVTGGKASNVTTRNSNTRGITVPGASDVVIDNFLVENTRGMGIWAGVDAGVFSRTPNNVRFQNGTILNAGQVSGTTGGNKNGIEANGCGDIHFQDIDVINPAARGVSIYANSYVHLRNIRVKTVTGGNSGYLLYDGVFHVENISAEDVDAYGIAFLNVSRLRFSNLLAKNTYKAGAPNRAVAFIGCTMVLGGLIAIVDDQVTPTGHTLHTSGTQNGSIGQIDSYIPNGALYLDNQSNLATGAVNGARLGAVHPVAYTYSALSLAAGASSDSGDLRGTNGVPVDARGVFLYIQGSTASGVATIFADSLSVGTSAFSPRLQASTTLIGITVPVELGTGASAGKVRLSNQSGSATAQNIYAWPVGYWR